ARLRGSRARRGEPRGEPRRAADRADRHGVPAAALPDAQSAPGAHARTAARPRVELRLRRRRPRAGDVHQLPAQEARYAWPPADQDRARGRLRAPGSAPLMASLRSRVLASVLVLSAAGLIALAAVTYAEQRSFLLGRVDQQARGAAPALSSALDRAGYRPVGALPASDDGGGGHGSGPLGSRHGPDGVGPNLPPGTYGQRRDASGRVLGHVFITYG